MGPQTKDRSKSSAAITCIKILLNIFNFLYMIIGVSVLGVGIWTEVSLKDYVKLTSFYNTNVPYVMIGVGVLILLVAVAGFYCTSKDKVAPLYMYGVFISLLAIMQVGAGIAGGVLANQLDTTFLTGLKEAINDTSKNMNAWNKVQQTLHCCGVEGASDWTNRGLSIPASCYDGGKIPASTTTVISNVTSTVSTSPTTPTTPATTPATAPTTTITTTSPSITVNGTISNTTGTSNGTAATTTIAPSSPDAGRRRRAATQPDTPTHFPKGCYRDITDRMKDSLAAIVGVCVGFVALQVLGAVLACCLAKKVNRNNYEQIY